MIPSKKKPRLDYQEDENSSSLTKEAVDDNNNTSNTCSEDSADRDRESHDNKHRSGPGAAPSRRPGTSGAKYQLRPRSLKARYLYDPDWSLPDPLEHKPRPPPLSRYRRKTANARERCRMRQINSAFESLRGVLPSWVCRRQAAADMTKISTLKLASAYIRSLQDMLDGSAPQDTCAWVLSGIFGEKLGSQEPQPCHSVSGSNPSSRPLPQPQPHTTQDADLLTLLYGTSDASLFHDNLDSFSSVSPDSDTDSLSLFFGCDSHIPWQQQQHSLVT